MKTYHFTAKFQGLEFCYHGEFKCISEDIEQIKIKAKNVLISKMKGWNITAETIFFEIYNNNRNQLFLYEKTA